MYDRAAPAARAAAAARVGRGVLHMAGYVVLAILDIAHPFAVEGLRVQRNHCALAHELAVAGVAAPLQMRAVGRDTGVHVA